MTETISLIISLISIVFAIYFNHKYLTKESVLEKKLKKVTELKDVFFITNQELGKQIKELKANVVKYKKLYDNAWHQNQELLDMRSENLSFYINVKPNNSKRKKRFKKV